MSKIEVKREQARIRMARMRANRLAGIQKTEKKKLDFQFDWKKNETLRACLEHFISTKKLFHNVGPRYERSVQRSLCSCRCRRKEDKQHDHVHELVVVTDNVAKAIAREHPIRDYEQIEEHSRDHEARFFKVECLQHALNVVHYLNCPVSQCKKHEHYADPVNNPSSIKDLPQCDGTPTGCRHYRKQLASSMNYVHSKNCKIAGCIKMRKRAQQSLLAKARKSI